MVEIEKFVADLIEDIAGKEVVSLVNLMGSKPISEFKLADRLKETVNLVRNMLYRLYSYNLVDFIRKKDRRKGWYIYYWSFDNMKAMELALDFKQKRVQHLKSRLEKEKKSEYFVCKEDGTRLVLEEAMEHDFRCPECDDILVRDEDVKKISGNISREIGKLEKEIVEIKEILEAEREKELKKLERAKKRKVKRKPKRKAKKRGRKPKKKAKRKKKKRKAKRKKKKAKKRKPKKKAKKKKVKKKQKKRKKVKRKPKKKKKKKKAKKKKTKRKRR